MSDADEAFLKYKSQQVLSWTLLNLQRLHERPSAMCAGRPLNGRTAFIVGASYSLGEDELALIEGDKGLMKIIEKLLGKEGGGGDLRKTTFFRGTGCRACGGTGYLGRTGIFEVMEISDELRPLIANKATSDEIDAKARSLGMASMMEDGMKRAFEGITTITEIIRATKS